MNHGCPMLHLTQNSLEFKYSERKKNPFAGKVMTSVFWDSGVIHVELLLGAHERFQRRAVPATCMHPTS